MAQTTSAERKAAIFTELHSAPHPFILANAWDAVTARRFECAGFPAVATTSAGVAAALSAADGEAISREEMLGALGRMLKAGEVPVRADIESGFGTSSTIGLRPFAASSTPAASASISKTWFTRPWVTSCLARELIEKE